MDLNIWDYYGTEKNMGLSYNGRNNSGRNMITQVILPLPEIANSILSKAYTDEGGVK